MTEPTQAKYYAVGEVERMTATSIQEAVEEFIEDREPDEIPETVEVQGYVPMEISDNVFKSALERLAEDLADEYIDPDWCDSTDLPKSAMPHWEKFTEAIKKDYFVWWCEQHGKPIKVNVADYVEQA